MKLSTRYRQTILATIMDLATVMAFWRRIDTTIKAFLFMMFPVVLSGCVTTGASNLPIIGVNYKWDVNDKCDQVSPEIHLSNVPSQTKSLRFYLVDQDRPMNNHGGGDIAYTGSNTIAKGAVKGIRGPCPPASESHRYELSVVATDENKNKIAEGAGTANCCR